jgi:hypothetical protein
MILQKNHIYHALTNRKDTWFVSPISMLVFGGIAVLYLVWAAFQGAHYMWGPYQSPVYSTPFVPIWWKLSPAFLLLWIPMGFRATCYYARKVFYRAGFGDPLACGVDEPYRKDYHGETKFPFILNNLHRYFLYGAILLLALHWYEFFASIFYQGVYVGVGTVLIAIDTVALTLYVGGCHSLRHLVGGGKRCVGCGCLGKVRYSAWKKISALNVFHNVWFWVSLFSIAIADLYIRLLAMGIIQGEPSFVFGI